MTGAKRRGPARSSVRRGAAPRRALNRFDLYELAVQSPGMQAAFLRALHPGRPTVLAEDFCGPASVARAWAALGAGYRSVGIDRDAEPLAHASARAEAIPGLKARVKFERSDVRRTRSRADVVAALNFAVCELHERAQLLAYLRRARHRLTARGVFVADLYGGRDAWTPGKTSVAIHGPAGRIRYTWEQRDADAASGRVINAMHFALPGGRTINNAFVYDWRLWGIPELRDVLTEAGFASTEVHAGYGEALDGDGNPIVRAMEPGDPLGESFVVFVVGRKGSR